MSDFPLRRRDFVTGSVTAAAAAALAPVSVAQTKPGAPKAAVARLPAKKALFVWGGWPGHEPDKCRDIFVPWLKKEGFEVVVSDNLTPYADAALMGSLDVIVQIWTQGTIEKEQLKGLINAVKVDGVGLAGWHGGLGDSFRTANDYEYMIGGIWVSHPGGKIDYEVNIVDHEDAVTAGLKDFKLHTEQYFMNVNPNMKVLATTTFSGEHDPWIAGSVMPVTWKKVHGKGRVFYTSLGHTADVFNTPEALTMTQRGILWAARSKHEPTPDLVAPVYPRR